MRTEFEIGDKVIFKGYNGKVYKHCKISGITIIDEDIYYNIKGTKTLYDTLNISPNRIIFKKKKKNKKIS